MASDNIPTAKHDHLGLRIGTNTPLIEVGIRNNAPRSSARKYLDEHLLGVFSADEGARTVRQIGEDAAVFQNEHVLRVVNIAFEEA